MRHRGHPIRNRDFHDRRVPASAGRNIQSQVGGANVNFNGSPSTRQAGSFVMVDGNGNARGNNGRQGNFNYHCTMHPGGNVADSNFNWTNGNLGMQPR